MVSEVTAMWFDECRDFVPVIGPKLWPEWILDARGFPMPRSGISAVGKTSEVRHPYKRDRRPYGPKERPAPRPEPPRRLEP